MRPKKKIATNPWNPLAAEIQAKYTPPAEKLLSLLFDA